MAQTKKKKRKKQTIMFVGAGKFQATGIQKAKEMGLKVVAVDRNPDAPGLKIADVPVEVNVTDVKGCIKIAKKYNVDGVITIASEVAIPTVAAIAEELKLPGISRKVAEISRDKELQRIHFKKFSVPSPTFRRVFTFNEAKKVVREIGFPVVVKPADNAGARGVTKVESLADLKNSFKLAKKYSRSGKILVEEFMKGSPISVEAFVYQGKACILALSDKNKTPPPHLVDTIVTFPSKYQKLARKIVSVAKKAIKAVGTSDGPVHIEMMVTKKGPMMIEMGARGPGFKVFTDILPYVTGVDVVKETIKLAMGQEPDLRKRRNKAAVLLFFKNIPGKVKEIVGIENVSKIKGIHEIEVYIKPGDLIRPLSCGDDRIGHIIAFGETCGETIRVAKMAEKSIRFVVEKPS